MERGWTKKLQAEVIANVWHEVGTEPNPRERFAAKAKPSSSARNAWRQIGISLRHSGHFLVVGSAGGSRCARATSALIGKTTR